MCSAIQAHMLVGLHRGLLRQRREADGKTPNCIASNNRRKAASFAKYVEKLADPDGWAPISKVCGACKESCQRPGEVEERLRSTPGFEFRKKPRGKGYQVRCITSHV